MPLLTGIPEGNVQSQSEIYIEGAPYIYYQDSRATLLHNPDSDGFYWGLSGTTVYPVYALACYEDVSLADDLQVNTIRCDQVGDKAVVQKRNHITFNFSLSSLFPLANITPLIRGGTVVTATDFEKLPLGTINNNIFYHVYLPKVYDDVTFDYVSITIHRAQFVDPWTIAMVAGDKWMLGGISAWALASEDTAAGQEFASVIRWDVSEL